MSMMGVTGQFQRHLVHVDLRIPVQAEICCVTLNVGYK